ncbi:cell division protein ZapD [Thalassotalea insulae]|uniref:Cell division protein ZapD n=1 Tax=Thalassotalea insulae TaxID=2056778 RepID=A0ABQ6GTK3_9GAMM|nr:cell division protein ZapD [Thalassotalea insulae]GLX77785.1 cell division protein ZapD [Thalassotalea insulae]
MSSVLYEHPLNERIRNYLKLEQLFAQTNDCFSSNIELSQQVFFSALFAILDTLERNDIKGDLIKDLEKLEQNLVLWSRAPNVDGAALEENIKQTISLLCSLKSPTQQWNQLKDDKFLSSLKQRYAMQGGNASFDVPQLKFWLNQPIDTIKSEISNWLSQLSDIFDALSLVLKFLRQRSGFETIYTEKGFYQDSGEGLFLLRMKLDSKAHYYPTVSGNKFRYSIRFMMPCDITGRKYCDQPIQFKLARC